MKGAEIQIFMPRKLEEKLRKIKEKETLMIKRNHTRMRVSMGYEAKHARSAACTHVKTRRTPAAII